MADCGGELIDAPAASGEQRGVDSDFALDVVIRCTIVRIMTLQVDVVIRCNEYELWTAPSQF